MLHSGDPTRLGNSTSVRTTPGFQGPTRKQNFPEWLDNLQAEFLNHRDNPIVLASSGVSLWSLVFL